MIRSLLEPNLPSPISQIEINGHRINVKRDDLIHSIVSGNKWRKLKYNLLNLKNEQVISFGGAFSNHIHALSYCCSQLNLRCHAFIRGRESYLDNPTLTAIKNWGAEITFLDSETYRKRKEKSFEENLLREYSNAVIIPEGGTNHDALRGVSELGQEISSQCKELKHVVLPVGTGGTMAGLINSLPETTKVIGISVAKEKYLEKEISKLVSPRINSWSVCRDYHFGGYGHCPTKLREFMKVCFMQTRLYLDPVYNSKAFYGFLDLVQKGEINPSTSLYIHTGGLQGISAYRYLYPDKLDFYSS